MWDIYEHSKRVDRVGLLSRKASMRGLLSPTRSSHVFPKIIRDEEKPPRNGG